MGVAGTWITVKGLDRGELLRRLDLVETANTFSLLEEWVPRGTYGGVATLESGRELFISRQHEVTSEIAQRVSIGVQLIMCLIEEHVMYSESYSFTDGVLDWHLFHHRPETGKEVVVKGNPPASLRKALTEAEELDRTRGRADFHFEVPFQVAESIDGFDPLGDPLPFDGMLTIVERKGRGGILKWLKGSF